MEVVDGIEIETHPIFTNYAISKCGKIWSFPRINEYNGRLFVGRFLRQAKQKNGYYRVSVYRNRKQYGRSVHRLVLETYVGLCPKGMECRHLNGVRTDNRLENLVWGIHQENIEDRALHGNTACGERQGPSKLTEEDVRLIFNAYHDGAYFQYELAEMFGVSQTAIKFIVNGKSWKHVDKTPISDMATT